MSANRPDFDSLINHYERNFLDSSCPANIALSTALDGLEFVQLDGMSAFWRMQELSDFVRRAVDTAVSCHPWGTWFAFVLTGSGDHFKAYVSAGQADTARRLLQSAYPGITFNSGITRNLGTQLQSRFAHSGVMTGVPVPLYDQSDESVRSLSETGHLSRIMRGMRGNDWVYVVRAWPIGTNDTRNDRVSIMNHVESVAPFVRRNVQQTIQDSRSHREHQTQSMSEVRSSDFLDPQAEHLVDLLADELSRIEDALALGQWEVAVDYGASTDNAARRLGSLLRSVFSGESHSGDSVRVQPRTGSILQEDRNLHTLLSSRELGALTTLPQESAPGFIVRDFVQFGVESPAYSRASRRSDLGHLVIDEHRSTIPFQLALNDLQKHALVTGVTGAGKTTTIRSILSSLNSAGVPFLVIEPAKTEYRSLLNASSGSAPLMPALNIFTLGNDHVAPFRLNPFEFDVPDRAGPTMLLEHIDLLKDVFNSAFVLYAPMPYVLEAALFEVYEDKGWSVVTGMNTQLGAADWSRINELNVFPTLGDLERKVESVTLRLGYDRRIEQDVIASLKARISTLRMGSKGLMLDVPRGTSMKDLLSKPTILELESIGNDNEKAFIIGILLTRLYEFRRLQSSEGKLPGGLQHLLVIEEAHRLLKHVNQDMGAESESLKAQAVETFANMFSEVRKYGQGILVAEQIPSKLASDVIKNSNLKITHRLVSEDDRRLVGGATNMTEDQMRHLSVLDTGAAVVFAEGITQPAMVQIRDVLAGHTTGHEVSNADIAAHMKPRISLESSLPVTDFTSYGVSLANFGTPDSAITRHALQFVSVDLPPAHWARILQRATRDATKVNEELQTIARKLAHTRVTTSGLQLNAAMRLVVILGSELVMDERRSVYGWQYRVSDQLRHNLTQALLHTLDAPGSTESQKSLYRFAQMYRSQTTRDIGPFPGCHHCRSICQYRADVRRMLTRSNAAEIVSTLTDTAVSNAVKLSSTAGTVRKLSAQWLGSSTPTVGDDGLGYCAVLHSIGHLEEDTQNRLADSIEPHLH